MAINDPFLTITVDYVDSDTKKRASLASYTTGSNPLYFGELCYNTFYTSSLSNAVVADRATAAAFVAVYLGCSNPRTPSGLEGPFVRDVLDLATRAQAYTGNLLAHHIFRRPSHPESLVTQTYLDRWNLEIVGYTVVIL